VADSFDWKLGGLPSEVLERVSDEDAANIPARMHILALARVHFEYETIFAMAGTPLEAFNRDSVRYPSIEEVIREQIARAHAVAGFAVSMRLISGPEAGEAIRQFLARHPEVWPRNDNERPANPGEDAH
jgi:hypothetical protein